MTRRRPQRKSKRPWARLALTPASTCAAYPSSCATAKSYTRRWGKFPGFAFCMDEHPACSDLLSLLCYDWSSRGRRQVVRHELPKLACAGSNPVARSKHIKGRSPFLRPAFFDGHARLAPARGIPSAKSERLCCEEDLAISLAWPYLTFNNQRGAAGMKRMWMRTGMGTKSAVRRPNANVYRRPMTITEFTPSRSCSVRILSAGIPILVRSPPYAPSTNAKGRSR